MGLRLESFDSVEPAPPQPDAERAASDAAQIAGFDRGYAAGWDDATAAAAGARDRLTEDLVQSLQAAAFTMAEARAYVLAGLRPLLEETFARLLPVAARQALPGLVADAIVPLAEEVADRPVILTIHPDDRVAVEAAVAEGHGLHLTLVEDASLPTGTARLQTGPSDIAIDPTAAAAAIAQATNAFMTLNTQEPAHG